MKRLQLVPQDDSFGREWPKRMDSIPSSSSLIIFLSLLQARSGLKTETETHAEFENVVKKDNILKKDGYERSIAKSL